MVFVDTSFLVALIGPRDGRHADAVVLNGTAMCQSLLLTNHVLGESWTVALSRYGRHVAVTLLRAIRASRIYAVEHATPETETIALDWLLRHDEREYSFVDAVSFTVMRQRGVDTVLTFDRDFEAAGFRTLRA